MAQLMTWFGEGKLDPCIAETYALADAPRAMMALAAREAKGKLVVVID